MTSSEEIRKRDRKQDVDGGYAWAILAGCFLMYMIVVGGLKAYGVLYVEMILEYERGSGNTAWIGGICILLTLVGGPVANLLSRRFSFRSVSFVGGLLVSVGFISSAFVPNMDYMFFTLGGLVGVGYSLAFAPCSTIISFYFEERRALANGITVSASGIGALIFPFAYKFLIETYGLSRTFFILGAFVLNICAAACFFRQPRELVLEKKRMWKRTGSSKTPDHKSLLNGNSRIKRSESELTRENSCCRGFFDGLFKCSLFCNPLFLMYVIAFVLCMNGYGPSVIQIPGHLQLLGYDNFHVAIALSTMGGCEVVARIAFGWLADKGYLKRRHIFIFSMSVAGVFSLIAPLFKNFYFYVGYAAIMGIFPGSFWSLISVLIIDVVGMKDFTAAFGLVSLCLALGSAITQPSMGNR
ncbi:MT12B-like protein [Mya arenaria]|uniref:MT12B-like protein n=1 Tax=Mya arenaria TaxID=6604 RepID=A0ABY7ESS7_MYAAR|nr:MT12B-like protein [Mya arenaria]